MALTASAPSVSPFGARDLSNFLPAPSRQQTLQHEIENTLLSLSALPETQEQKILLDLGIDGRSHHVAIQCNQLPLFERLEELVGQLTPEERAKLLSGLHPAMSVKEREALELVVEHGLKGLGVVPKPLRIRKVRSATEDARKGATAEANVEGTASISEPSQIRRRELVIALAEKDVGLTEMLSNIEDVVALQPSKSMPVLSTTAAAEARRKKQEVANMFALAAKKLQALDESLSLAGPVHTPTIREGLHLVKAAGSALRAYTDVTPREVVLRASQESGRPSREVARPAGIEEMMERGTEEEEIQPPWMNELFLKRLSGQRAPEPAPVVSQGGGGGERAPPFIQQQIPRSVTMSTMASLPPPLPRPSPPPGAPAVVAPAPSVRPRSDPPPPGSSPPPIASPSANRSGKRQSTCPWPDSFFTSPRAAPVPRASSLPVPPRRPPRSEQAEAAVRSLALPPASPLPPTPPPKSPKSTPRISALHQTLPAPALSATSETMDSNSSSTGTARSSAISDTGTAIEATPVKRKGSIAAARAGIAERARREGRDSAVLEVRRETSYPRFGMFQGAGRGKGCQ